MADPIAAGHLAPAMLIAGYLQLILSFFSALFFIGAWSAAQIWRQQVSTDQG